MQLQSSAFHLGQGSPWLNEILFGICPIENMDELSAYYFTKERCEKMQHIIPIPKTLPLAIHIKPIKENLSIDSPLICPIKTNPDEFAPLKTQMTKSDSLPKKTIRKDEWFTTNQPDPLFWCIYAFQYGVGEYMQIQKYSNRRLEENKKMGDFFKKSPKNLKTGNHPVTNGLAQEIISDFFTAKDTTSHIQLIAMAIYYNIRIILIKHGEQSYIEFQGQTTEKTCVIYEYTKSNKRMSYRINMANTEQIPELTELYKWHTWNQPLRAQSAYKLAELAEIANRLKIDPIGLKKGELYTKIANLFQ